MSIKTRIDRTKQFVKDHTTEVIAFGLGGASALAYVYVKYVEFNRLISDEITSTGSYTSRDKNGRATFVLTPAYLENTES